MFVARMFAHAIATIAKETIVQTTTLSTVVEAIIAPTPVATATEPEVKENTAAHTAGMNDNTAANDAVNNIEAITTVSTILTFTLKIVNTILS
jgi:hypothetical protein